LTPPRAQPTPQPYRAYARVGAFPAAPCQAVIQARIDVRRR